jgi:hypothetical protein
MVTPFTGRPVRVGRLDVGAGRRRVERGVDVRAAGDVGDVCVELAPVAAVVRVGAEVGAPLVHPQAPMLTRPTVRTVAAQRRIPR